MSDREIVEAAVRWRRAGLARAQLWRTYHATGAEYRAYHDALSECRAATVALRAATDAHIAAEDAQGGEGA